jgi:hypothetical protein
MTPEEIKFLVGLLPGFSVGVLVASGVGYLLVKHFASGYLNQKGKNLADKEDIAALTHEVEQVKRQQAELLETAKFRNQLRMAAIDRRLEAHQQAFTLLRELIANTHSEDVGKAILKCQDWWEKNCLYLEPQARHAFLDAYAAASSHRGLLQASEHRHRWGPAAVEENVEQIKRNWARITSSLDVVLQAVALPILTEQEAAKRILSDESLPPVNPA